MHRIIHLLKIIKNNCKKKNQNSPNIDTIILEKQAIRICNTLTRNIGLLNSVSQLHSKTFTSYKNIHNGKDIVIVASGPSLKYFDPIENAIYIAVNRSFKFDKVKFDYLFMEDYHATRNYINEAENYNCTKFYGIVNHNAVRIVDGLEDWLIPESIALKQKAKRFYTESPYLPQCIQPDVPFAYNLTSEPLYTYGTIVFPALQFALWTNPKKIYIVGMDNTQSGYYDGSKQESRISSSYIKKHVVKFKKFVNDYYPETKIIMVNPVGLKNIFEDIYTKSYMENQTNSEV